MTIMQRIPSTDTDKPNTPRGYWYWYSYGFKSRAAAWDDVEELYATGEISPCDDARVAAYVTTDGATRYGVKLRED